MANHKSAQKRIRQTETHRLHNRYYHKTARNAVRALRGTTDGAAAAALMPKVAAMLDKLAKQRIIHSNKAANLKSSLQRYVNRLTSAASTLSTTSTSAAAAAATAAADN